MTVMPKAKKKTKADALTSKEIADRLGVTFSGPEWVIFFEVRSEMGTVVGTRYADAIAMSTYATKGLKIHGFEFKSDRADLMHELRTVDKSAVIQRYCDYWWLVLGHKNLIRAGELPATWGLIVPYGNGLRKIVQAPELKPCVLDRPFVASVLRSAQRHLLPYAQIENAEQSGYRQGLASANNEQEYKLEQLREAVKAFEKASGISIQNEWQGERIGAAARIVHESGVDNIARKLEAHLKGVRRIVDHTEKALLELRENETDKLLRDPSDE